jgi:hypothetical protein
MTSRLALVSSGKMTINSCAGKNGSRNRRHAAAMPPDDHTSLGMLAADVAFHYSETTSDF